ncbi:Bromodomain-containing protein, partial [Rhizodiscina lignyota]
METPVTPAPEIQQSFDSTPMSAPQKKYLLEQVRKTKKVKNSAAFLTPVDPVALNIPTYFEIVKNPMDITTLEEKLKTDKYTSVDEVVKDFYLMIDNAKAFNGPTHAVYLAGENLRSYFVKTLIHLPKKGEEPSEDVPKKAKKPAPEKRTSLPRRDTQHSAADGRPKREIHRPAPKDLPYSNPRPRKKKSQMELKFCEYALKQLYDKKNYEFVYPFYKPVDPVALNIPNYHNVIKKPMDLSTVEQNLKNGQYVSAKEFKEHVELMLKNCFKFNMEGDFVYSCGKKTEELFKQLWTE